MAASIIFCSNCGAEGDSANAYCTSCGASYRATGRRLAGHIGYLLNELAIEPLRSAIQPAMTDVLDRHYRGELVRVLGGHPAPAAAVAAVGVPAAAPMATAAPVAAAPTRPAREPYDWSWLAEQQASVFLFAGAFLTVIAALIYVGYSGQAVSGGLKMSLLAGYTLAFLAAGHACRRIDRVETAGNVFFAVGAILVPLNFIAARSIFSDEEISAESMWLAGSIVSALFYAAVAWTGLGRAYTVAAGAAILSATLAALYVAAAPVEWWPLAIIAAGFAMTLTQVSAPQDMRSRLGDVWSPMGQAAAALAAVAAGGIAALSTISYLEFDVTRAFLPVTLGAFTVGALYIARGTLWTHAAAAALAGFSATWISVAYAMDWPAEGYAITIALLAVALIVGEAITRHAQIADIAPMTRGGALYVASLIAATTATLMAVAILMEADDDFSPYELASRWFALAVLAPLLAVAAIDAFVLRTRLGVVTLPIAAGAVASSALYGWDVSPEWQAAVIATSGALTAGVARFAKAAIDARLHAAWREDALVVARIGAGAAAVLALLIAGDASDATPVALDTRWFLAITFALVTTVAAIDASRKAMTETTTALGAGITATVLACLWRFDAPVAMYGVALAATGIALAAGGRAVRLPWVDGTARDAVALGAIGVATVPFWPAYADDGRSGAAVHLAAATIFALAAIMDRSERTLALVTQGNRVRVSVGWLYAAAFTAIAGYVFVLRSMPAAEGADGGSLAMPLLAAAIAVAAIGASAKRWRPEFSIHLYASALLTAAVALSLAPDMQTLAIMLTVITAASAAIALYENVPLYAAPAAVGGAAAMLSWHIALDGAAYALPLLYAAAALALYAAGFALQPSTRRWSDALRGAGGAFALIAPAAAYVLMSDTISDGAIDGVRWYESALYQATVVTVAIAGVLALAEASIANRRWIIVPASAVLLSALLMQIGRFNPDNVQAYTAVIGFYLVALGAFGLGRFRLVPDMAPAATSFEALGAATIILPTFIQSFAPGWHYDALLIAEASAFLAAGIALRRRGVLGVALFFLVAAGGRALFDAISAMPNWIVAMTAGIALLAIGFAILAGRERWDRWQEAVIRWWGETSDGHATP